jgi:septal ring factor EnvC (AmiA/AmiB activator)
VKCTGGACRRGFAALTVAAPIALVVLATSSRADRAEELERLQDAIAESRERVGAYERSQRSVLEAVEALDRAATLLAVEVRRAGRNVESARAELAVVEAESASLATQLRATERAMSGRAVALYKAGDHAAMRMLFSAAGIREFLSRTSMLRLLLTRDGELLESHRSQSALLADSRRRAASAAVKSEEAAARLRERERELASERRSKKEVVASLKLDRARERAALVELEKAARALEETLRSLRDAQPGKGRRVLDGPPFATLKRMLPPPVDAPIARGFGRVIDSEFFTETVRKGVEYDAALGDSVRAVADGTVRFAGWFRGFGRIVILDHGDSYFTVSGHLSEMEVEVDDRVDAGATIGAVGETGSLSGPQLYFEIRREGQALDPAEWLRRGDSG